MKSVGYGEKGEMQELNSILESCLSEMHHLEETTKEFEKKIAEMEGITYVLSVLSLLLLLCRTVSAHLLDS